MRNTISGSAMRTFMKLVVAADSDVVVGCHMVGDDSAEIMQVRHGCAREGGGEQAVYDCLVGFLLLCAAQPSASSSSLEFSWGGAMTQTAWSNTCS
jgi:hypothetical protein